MITWGISSNSHNAALAVFSNDSLMFASQSERFSRKKNDPYICEELINYAYKYGEPELICWYEQPLRKKLRQIRQVKDHFKITSPSILTVSISLLTITTVMLVLDTLPVSFKAVPFL